MGKIIQIAKFGWPYMRKYWGRLALGVVLGLVFGVTNLGFVWASKTLTSRMEQKAPEEEKVADASLAKSKSDWVYELKGKLEAGTDRVLDNWLPKAGRPLDTRQVMGLLVMLPLLMAARGFTGYFSSYCLIWVSERVVHDLRMQVVDKFHSLSLDFFNRSKMGDLITRISGDTSMLQRTLSLVFSDLIKEPATILAVFTGMVIIDWQLSVFVLVFMPLCAVPLIIFGRKVKKAMEGNIKATISQSSLLIEAASGVRVVKAFNMEDRQRSRFDNHSRQILHHNMKSTQARELVNPCIEIISILGLGLLITFIFYSGANLSDLVGLVASVAILFTPIKKLGRVHVFIQQTSVGVERLFSLFREKATVSEKADPVVVKDFKQAITFDNVSFAYGDDLVLRDFTLELPLGHKLGIAGESGSGKSTLINLLLRFYDPKQGRICFDGIDFKEAQLASLRDRMALVSQDVVIFDMSVAENIACGKPGATREEIEAAAKSAFAHDFIMQLPNGYDTQVGERGVTLSGGQRQRLAIARAFVKDAPILLLDEATAALDSNAEAEVQAAIERLETNRTVICIAHRLSTLSNMDQVIVLSEGRMIESGTFEELVAKDGEFARMARRQGIDG